MAKIQSNLPKASIFTILKGIKLISFLLLSVFLLMLFHDMIPHHHHDDPIVSETIHHKHSAPDKENEEQKTEHSHNNVYYHSHFDDIKIINEAIIGSEHQEKPLSHIQQIAEIWITSNPPPLLSERQFIYLFSYLSDYCLAITRLRAPPGI